MDLPNVNQNVMELLELTKINSPYAGALVRQHRQKLVDKLIKQQQIDSETADYLLD